MNLFVYNFCLQSMSPNKKHKILQNETAANVPEHVHAAQKTLNPDWVELAGYLIGAHNQTWFSYSHGWSMYIYLFISYFRFYENINK